ncbi:CDP-glycerol glycerophosphotransferase family protein [Leucobacter sp. GX24907]
MKDSFEVVGFRWDRVMLSFEAELPRNENFVFYLMSADDPDAPLLPIDTTVLASGRYEGRLNVTRFHERKQVPNGAWRLVARNDSTQLVARFDLTRVRELDDQSRAFVYNQGYSSYTVTFGISDDEDAPDLMVWTYAFGRGRPKAPNWRAKRIAKLRKWWRKRKRSVLRRIFRLGQRLRKKDSKRILFASEARPNMQGNLKAVHDRMVERGLDQQFDFRYSFRTHHSTSRSSAFRLGWQMGKADIVLVDDYFPVLMDLSDTSKQKVIQLWHAGSGFKSIGYSRFGQYGSPHLTNSHRLYSYAICGSQHLRDVYSEAFGIEREAVIATGLPRIDGFLREGREEEVRQIFDQSYPAAVGKRKLLFAPTFRGRGAGDAHYSYAAFDFAALYAACGEDSVVLFRQHHFILDPAPIPEKFRDRLIDVSEFPDTNDLLLVSDVLITDYSSIIYEYALLRRPMVFFAPDLEVYSATRGMHRDYREAAPGEIATDFGQFLELIADPNLSLDKTEAFLAENFDYIDTNNSDRVIDQLILSDPTPSQVN